VNLVDYEMPLGDAVNAPRLHFENGKLNAENGFDLGVFKGLEEHYSDQKIWKNKSLYFGGAHAVSVEKGQYSGAGDVRRGGASIVC
jgi:gamma-glutamyltranspeptidase/glutathione hydrolase